MRAPTNLLKALLCVVGPVCLLGGTVAAAETLAIPAEPPARFDSTILGAIADGGIGTSMDGDTLMFEVGGQSAGLRSVRDRRWLLQWDALLAVRGGYLANQHPYLFLVGGHELAWAEGGYRFEAPARWSTYAGLRLGNEVQILAHPGLALSDVDTINRVDRVGGTVAAGVIRAAVGASFLDGWRSLLVVAFFQEELHAAEANTPAQAFTGAGLGARFDLARSLEASADGFWGVAPVRSQPLLGLTDRTTHVAASATFRKTFRNRMWTGASISIERDSDHLVYSGGLTYDTTNAPRFGVAVVYGLPLGRRR